MRKLLAAALLALLTSTSAFAETIKVAAGGDLQAALNRAVAGDTVALEAGATFKGQYVLPAKTGQVTLTSDSVLPLRRVTPTDAPLMAKIGSPYGQHAIDGYNTKNWKIDGIQFLSNFDGHGEILAFWDAENIYLDRILIVMAPLEQQKRGVLGNGKNINLTRSHISGIWRAGQDSQAFCAWDGAGPYNIIDNYLEAAAENVMFGGAKSLAVDRIPSDILVEDNHFAKPMFWYDDLVNSGFGRSVKNLFELKSAKRVIIRNNLFENNWADAQSGAGILFTVRNDEGPAPWSVIEDVLFENNIVRNTPLGINILGIDSYQPSEQLKNLVIRGNDITVTGWKTVQIGGQAKDIYIYGNKLNLPPAPEVWMRQPLSLYRGQVWLTGEAAPRDATYAVEHLVWADNIYPADTCIFAEVVGCVKAIESATRTFSFIAPDVAQPPPPPPPTDPLLDLKAEVKALQTEVAQLKAWRTAVGTYFGSAPNQKSIAQVMAFLRLMPK